MSKRGRSARMSFKTGRYYGDKLYSARAEGEEVRRRRRENLETRQVCVQFADGEHLAFSHRNGRSLQLAFIVDDLCIVLEYPVSASAPPKNYVYYR